MLVVFFDVCCVGGVLGRVLFVVLTVMCCVGGVLGRVLCCSVNGHVLCWWCSLTCVVLVVFLEVCCVVVLTVMCWVGGVLGRVLCCSVNGNVLRL